MQFRIYHLPIYPITLSFYGLLRKHERYRCIKDPIPDISFKTIIKQKMFRNNFCLDTFSTPRTRFMFGDFSSLFGSGGGSWCLFMCRLLTLQCHSILLIYLFIYLLWPKLIRALWITIILYHTFLGSTFICNFSVYKMLHPIIWRGFNFNKDKVIISYREMLIRISVGYVVLCSIYHNYELLLNATKEE